MHEQQIGPAGMMNGEYRPWRKLREMGRDNREGGLQRAGSTHTEIGNKEG
jgi:hypothetical protein